MGNWQPGELASAVEALLEDRAGTGDGRTCSVLIDQMDIVLRAVRPLVEKELAGKINEIQEEARDLLVGLDALFGICPFTYQPADQLLDKIRCVLPVGHGPDHKAEDGTAWFNPYEHDSDAEELSGHPVRKVDRVQYCGDAHDYSDAGKSATLYCRKAKMHDGEHQALTGETWPHSIRRCPEWLDAAGQRGHCEHNEGHPGNHDSTGYGQWVTDCATPHVLTGSDGGAETVHCSMHNGHAGPSHFDARSGSSWPV